LGLGKREQGKGKREKEVLPRTLSSAHFQRG